MITAFQRNGFQDDAFQIGVTVGGGGDWPGLHLLWLKAKEEAARIKREQEREAEIAAEAAPPVVEVVTAMAAPVVTDLSPLVAASQAVEAMATADMRKADEDRALREFMALMVKLAQEEFEC